MSFKRTYYKNVFRTSMEKYQFLKTCSKQLIRQIIDENNLSCLVELHIFLCKFSQMRVMRFCLALDKIELELLVVSRSFLNHLEINMIK